MINISEVLETNKMILEENLDVRTITMGISLLDCADASLKKTCDNVYAKLMRLAKNLVKTGDEIGREFGVPIVNKRVSITPAAIVGSACCRKPAVCSARYWRMPVSTSAPPREEQPSCVSLKVYKI